jgi:hypothetical protein
MKLIAKLLPWVPAAILAITAMLVAGDCSRSREQDHHGKVVVIETQVPFNPITLLGLKIQPDTIKVGDPVTIINGICNNTGHPVIAEVYLAAQRRTTDPAISSDVVVFIQRDQGQGSGRGRAMTLDNGCSAQDPVEAKVPDTILPGEWRAFLEVVVHGENGQEQREAEFSNYFKVVAP